MPFPKMNEGGFADVLRHMIMGDKAESVIRSDANNAAAADAIDPVITSPQPELPSAEMQAAEAARKAAEANPTGMANGGYPHVTFMENMPPKQVAETVHLEGEVPKMAEGGAIHKAEGRDKEPAKPTDIEMSEKKKLAAIYKAMGMQKYAPGGLVEDQVDLTQLPGAMNVPQQTDPDFWSKVKDALAKVAKPVTGAAEALATPVQKATEMATPIVPSVVSATNKMLGTDLPVPQLPEAPAAPAASAPEPVAPPVMPAPAPMKEPVMPAAAKPAPTPAPATPVGDTAALTKDYNAEDRQALAGDMNTQQHGTGSIIAQAMAGLGDALAAKGGREQHSLQGIFNMQKQQRDEALANFDKARQARIDKVDLEAKTLSNAVQRLALQSADRVDEGLNKMLGAPAGTKHKDLPLYVDMRKTAIEQQEKDGDLYMKAHKQAADEVEAAVKNASMLSIKPSQAQIQASGKKLADSYYNRAKGNILIKPSDGGPAVWIPSKNVSAARKMDPNLQIIQ